MFTYLLRTRSSERGDIDTENHSVELTQSNKKETQYTLHNKRRKPDS